MCEFAADSSADFSSAGRKNVVASEPISVATGELQSFTLDVSPDSRVTCETTGETTGDADLYVRYNAAPAIADGIYDCASYSSTDSNEACALNAPGDALVLWATIQGWSAAENVILTCTSNGVDTAGGGTVVDCSDCSDCSV